MLSATFAAMVRLGDLMCEGCGNEMWAGQCHTILMAFQLIFTRMLEMGLVERWLNGGALEICGTRSTALFRRVLTAAF